MRVGPVWLVAAAEAALGPAQAPPAATLPPEAAAGYVGVARCAERHTAMAAKWSSGRHSRIAFALMNAGITHLPARQLRSRLEAPR